jgi:hypothetical protein
VKIYGEVEVVEPYPAVYIPSIDSIVLAELHLGYEEAMVEQGLFLPRVQLRKEMEMLGGILEKRKAERIIVNGDFKHEFSRGGYREYKEIGEMLDFLQDSFREVKLVRGNHDNFLISPAKTRGVELVEHYTLGDYYFIHGHKVPVDFGSGEAGNVVIAHEHPAVAIYDEIGVKEKIPCFLHGEMGDGRKILVLPAFSPLFQGSEVNTIPPGELLSPVLKNYVEVDELEVVGISPAAGALRFSKLGILRLP